MFLHWNPMKSQQKYTHNASSSPFFIFHRLLFSIIFQLSLRMTVFSHLPFKILKSTSE